MFCISYKTKENTKKTFVLHYSAAAKALIEHSSQKFKAGSNLPAEEQL